MEIRGYSSDSEKVWDYENAFYWFSPINRIAKQIAHFELYKKTLGVPGDILEFGVFKGSSLIKFATFRELLENSDSRKIIGFDTFGDFPITEDATGDDKNFVDTFEDNYGYPLDLETFDKIFNLKGFRNIDLVKGNIFETLPIFLEKNPHTKVSLLHLDMDIYKPTFFALEKLWSRLSSGGIIVIDDYPCVEGANNAIDEFIVKNNLKVKVEKTNYYFNPSFIIKP